MQIVRIYEMPDYKMVSSGIGMFGEEKFEACITVWAGRKNWVHRQMGRFPIISG